MRKEPEAHTRLRERATDYNRLIKKGLSQKEVAEHWGWTQSQVASLVYRAKKVLGMKVMNAVTGQLAGINRYKLVSDPLRPRRNEHGGGKSGIKSCRCDLCVEVRRKTRAAYAQIYKPRRAELEAAKRKAKKQEE